MQVIAQVGHPDHAVVYILEYPNKHRMECVESIQPPIPREKKWVLLVSTLFGCPIGCPMCDAGGFYHGKPNCKEILQQIDFLVSRRYHNNKIPSEQFKIQFARMGEPCLNNAVLDVLKQLPKRYDAPGLMPSISTVAPRSATRFLDKLIAVKNKLYSNGRFQFQFSIHTTDVALRQKIVPAQTWSFSEMARYGQRFFEEGDRKLTLNFAVAENHPIDPSKLAESFSPSRFLIKLTPLNPTYRANENKLISGIDPVNDHRVSSLIQHLKSYGFDVVLSIGNTEENLIGSNCGQYLRSHLNAEAKLDDGYLYTPSVIC